MKPTIFISEEKELTVRILHLRKEYYNVNSVKDNETLELIKYILN